MKKQRQYVYDNSSLAVRRYRRGRSSLLLMIIITALNTALAATGSEIYYVFTNYAAYFSAMYGRAFYEQLGETLYLVVGCAVSALVLLPYLLCWIFSKKRRGWLIAAAVMFTVDTLLVIGDAVIYMDLSYLLDVAIHIWVLVELVMAVRSGKEALAELNAPAPVQDVEFHDASVAAQADTPALGMPQEERKYRVIVEAMYGSRTIQVRRSYGLTELVIDGRLYGKWEGISERAYEIVARVDGREIATRFLPTGKQTIEVDGEIIAKKQRLI